MSTECTSFYQFQEFPGWSETDTALRGSSSSSSSSVMTATNVSWSVSGQGDLHQLSLTSSSGDHFSPIGWGCYMLYLKSSSDNFSASCCPDHSLMAASLSIDASLMPCDACCRGWDEMSDVQNPIIRPSFVAAESSSKVHFTPQTRYKAAPLVSSCSVAGLAFIMFW